MNTIAYEVDGRIARIMNVSFFRPYRLYPHDG
jgi:hypothetical protein